MGMSLPGRPKGEYRSAQHEGTPVSTARHPSARLAIRRCRRAGRAPAVSLAPLFHHPTSLSMQKHLSLPALTLMLLATGPALAQRFEVTPASADIVAGEPLQIRLSGLPANAEVSLSATQRH